MVPPGDGWTQGRALGKGLGAFRSNGALALISLASIAAEMGTMVVSEEIELVHAMEERGMDVVETDLGEFIIQIGKDSGLLPAPVVA